MKPEAQRIAIAEACGWKRHKTRFGHEWESPDGRRGYVARTEDEGGDYHLTCPDYLTDLNAMAEAEKWLREKDPDAFERYLATLLEIIDLEGGYYACANASQRLQGILRTLNLWTD